MENSPPPCKAERKRRRPPNPPPQADKLRKKKSRRSTQVENTSIVSSAPIAAESVDHISSYSSSETESNFDFDFDFDDDDDDDVQKKPRRSTQGENTSIVSSAPIAAEEEEENAAAAPASASSSYILRRDRSHPGDVALRGFATKCGGQIYSVLKSNHLIFNPISAHRAGLSPPFTFNLSGETTRDERPLIYSIEREGKLEKVGHTRNINRRYAAYDDDAKNNKRASPQLTIVADLDSIPLRVDKKLQHSWRGFTNEIDEDPNIPQYMKDLWIVFSKRGGERIGLKRRAGASLVEIGCQEEWGLPCEAEAFQAVGCKQVDEWLALIESAVENICVFLNTVNGLDGMKPKAARPMMMLSWKPARHQFHEDRDPSKPMSSKITAAEAYVGQNNWEDALPFEAKPGAKTPEDTYSDDYTPEEKKKGKKRIEQWIENISKSGEFGLLDTNSTIFGNGSGLADFLEGLEYKSHESYMEGDLTLWVREPKDPNTMASVILACKPFCQAAHYDPKFEIDLSVRIRRNLAVEVARQVCWYVRDFWTVTSTTEYPGIVAACACAVLIKGFHQGGEGIRIVNAIVRDIWSPPEHYACVNNGLKKSHTLMRHIPGQNPQDPLLLAAWPSGN